jgi:hypothetical protein
VTEAIKRSPVQLALDQLSDAANGPTPALSGRLTALRDKAHASLFCVLLSSAAAMCGLSRMTLYEVLWSGRMSADTAELLTLLVRAFEAGKLRFGAPARAQHYPNLWEIVETWGQAAWRKSARKRRKAQRKS